MTTNEFERLEQDLEAAFAVPVPSSAFEMPANEPTARPSQFGARAWRLGAAAAIAAVFVAAIAFLPGYLGGAKTVGAEELLSQSAAATANLRSSTTSYHLRARFEAPGNTFVAETWSFGLDGNRSESRDFDGNLLYGQVANPTDYWIYATVDDGLRVVHVAGATERVNDFLAGSESLEEIVQGLAIDGCQDASIEGIALVAGRETYVVRVEPSRGGCRPASGESRKEVGWAQKLGGYTVWIDKETNVQLRFEARDGSGVVTSRYEAELFETGSGVDRSILEFEPGPGAAVIEAADYSEAKSALYAGATETQRQSPQNPKQ